MGQDVTEYEVNPEGGFRVNKLEQILLNGNNVRPAALHRTPPRRAASRAAPSAALRCARGDAPPLPRARQVCMLVPGGDGPLGADPPAA